ncbi:MAG: ChaN family lipoprotein [Planctomycetota bacterium]|jgi:uncharacterized iron-regulated protein
MKRAIVALTLGFALATVASASDGPKVAEHRISVTLNPDHHLITGSDKMTLASPARGGELAFTLHAGVKVLRALWRDRVLAVRELPAPGGRIDRKVLIALPDGVEVRELILEYTGKIHDPVQRSRAMGFVRGDATSGIISKEGVFLHGGTYWYPRGAEVLSNFRIEVRLPEPWYAVTEGDLLGREERDGTRVSRWRSTVPLDGPALVANRFAVKGKDFDGVRISAYFLPQDARLADDYIDTAGRYLKFYRKALGPYPFNRFDIVENFFTTGYGMPCFTLLGPQVIKMAHFGSRTLGPHSLGHELVHCWWGNYVYIPRGGGNWCEGLTTYCSNYYWVERFDDTAKAREYRRKSFLKYSIFVDEKNDYPVRRFRGKTKEVDDFIGYTKSSMVLHTLRVMIGEEPFFQALRAVRDAFGGRVATWDDFRKAFEKASGRDLEWFFRQWIDGKGAPVLSVEKAGVRREKDGWKVEAQVVQTGEPFRVIVPVVLTTEKGRLEKSFELTRKRNRIEWRTKAKPLTLEVDPDFHVFRRFHRGEIHPCLELTLSHEKALVVYPTRGTAKENAFYKGIAERYGMSSRRIPAKADKDVTDADLAGRSLLVLGGPGINGVAERLSGELPGRDFAMAKDGFTVAGKRYTHKGQSALVSVTNPRNGDRHVTFYVALSPDGMMRARLMAHYGWESYLVYDVRKPRQVLSRGSFAPSAAPCTVHLGEAPGDVFSDPAFGPQEFFAYRFKDSKRLDFPALIQALSAYDVVFVGEYHNDWATHHAEFGLLAGLAGLGDRKVAVAMEMFERDVQGALDDYLAGRISEVAFLKSSRPWGNYFVGYREIIEFAKANGIPVIAANVPRRLASTLARGGRAALEGRPAEERKLFAREVKTPEGPYKEKFIRTIFGGANARANPMAERFYLSQCLKDDTMAESIADFLKQRGRKGTRVLHYNGSFHSDGHMGAAGKLEAMEPGLRVAVLKIVSDRDLLQSSVEPYRKDADILLVCRKRGEDHQDRTYSFQVARRLHFTPVLPRNFDPAKKYPAVVAFHAAGSVPAALTRLLADWGLGDAILLLPEGPEPVWNADGTPGRGWIPRNDRVEAAQILATFGAELAGLLRTAYPVDPDRLWFLGFGQGADAAALCTAGLPPSLPCRLIAIDAAPNG